MTDMRRIGVLSDTHGVVPKQVYSFFDGCDELWHAGDCGSDVLRQLREFKPVRAVFGNIDGAVLRYELTERCLFDCEGLKVLMTHIGGWPGHYPQSIRELLKATRPDIFVCGHSHILRVMYDKEQELLLINPGAAGNQGLHKVSTLVRFVVEERQPRQLEICEWNR